MNLLSELRERLIHIIMAGTQLIEEDFRLKKTIQSFAPLAEKNPVFKKIHTDLEQLLASPREQQGCQVLNLLGLVDAVLYTQAPYGVEGALLPLPQSASIGKSVQMRYSQILPILQALSTTGSGRLEVLENAIHCDPEVFQDYRILHALVCDLNDAYGEMANLVFCLLRSLGTGETFWLREAENYNKPHQFSLPVCEKNQLVVLLKQGFDPEGKSEMAKRVSLISYIAREEENSWYLSLLDTAKKDVRLEVIRALQYSADNIPLLLTLVKKERGKAKDAAYETLGAFDCPELLSFWEEELSRDVKSAAYLRNSTAPGISDLLAQRFQAVLEGYIGLAELPKDEAEKLTNWCQSLHNKTSNQMLALYRWISEHKVSFPKTKPSSRDLTSFAHLFWTIRNELMYSLLNLCPQNLVEFLNALPFQTKGLLVPACILADLLTLPAQQVYDKWHKADRSELEVVFQRIRHQDGVYRFWMWSDNEDVSYCAHTIQRPLKEALDPRWIDIFLGNKWDTLLHELAAGSTEERRHKTAKYFYNQVAHPISPNNRALGWAEKNKFSEALSTMSQCGWTDFDGLLLGQFKANQHIYKWQLVSLFQDFQRCAGEDATQREIERVLAFYDQCYQGGSGYLELRDTLMECGLYKG